MARIKSYERAAQSSLTRRPYGSTLAFERQVLRFTLHAPRFTRHAFYSFATIVGANGLRYSRDSSLSAS
jgi:hypothetical protein